jgi:transcriptional regulator ATRX
MVHPGRLGTKTQFEENFVNVLGKGQTVDSELSDVRAMKLRSFILHKMLESNFLVVISICVFIIHFISSFDRYASAFRHERPDAIFTTQI